MYLIAKVWYNVAPVLTMKLRGMPRPKLAVGTKSATLTGASDDDQRVSLLGSARELTASLLFAAA